MFKGNTVTKIGQYPSLASKEEHEIQKYKGLKVMYEYGGIYMDTDVELFKCLDKFLQDDAFVGYADDTYIGSGMFGCSKRNEFCKQLLDYYQGRHFIDDDGKFYDVPNNQIYTAICMKKLGFKLGDDHIKCGNTKVYSSDYLSPFKKRTIGDPNLVYSYANFDCTQNTHAIHYTVFSWRRQRNLFTIAKLMINQLVRSALPRSMYFKLKRNAKLKEIEERVRL